MGEGRQNHGALLENASKRLFIGVHATLFDYNHIKRELSQYFEGKWVEPENIHLTFAFLGHVANERPIIEKLEGLSYPKKIVALRGFGVFGRPPRILFVQAWDKTLLKLCQEIDDRLAILPDKPFKPHVTLMRIKRTKKRDFRHALEKLHHIQAGQIKLDVTLFESILTSKGPIYRALAKF